MSKVDLTSSGDFADAPGLETLAIRSGHVRGPEREHSEPIYTTSSYVFESAEQAAALFSEKEKGNIYSRFTNPTVTTFETRLGALERADYCIATASGMAAISGLILSLLKPGDHIVASYEMFGSTVSLLNKIFRRFEISTTLVSVVDADSWQNALQANTRMLLLETPSNPLCQVADIRTLSDIARGAGAFLVVDNCFCTPILQQPLTLGADVVIHTATKYLDGQGRCVGGAMATNDKSIHDDFFAMLRTTGPSMSPFNAWVFAKGLETLALRMRQHCANAHKLANFLDQHPGVKQVFYPGLESHPQHGLASSQQSGYGGIVSLLVNGGRKMAWRVINETRMISITANLGDTKTTITHPATTTHARITQQERDRAGVTENLIRISVGLEYDEDIVKDIERGLASL